MIIITKIMSVISIVLLVCTLICGLWVRFHPQEDMNFHFVLSLVAVIVSLATIVLYLFVK